MRLLLITFVLDEAHGALAWQSRVAVELAKNVEHVTVLTSSIGRLSKLPANINILTPPARPLGLPHRFGGRFAFNKDIYNLCRARRIDSVFIHMDMDWAYWLYPTFRLLRLPVVMWYAHGTTSARLRLAMHCADRVVTSTPEGCQVNSNKINVIGQAIDTDHFSIPEQRNLSAVVYVGRISRRKRVDILYKVAKYMHASSEFPHLPFDVVGPLLSLGDMRYEHELRDTIYCENMDDRFRMLGFIPFQRSPEIYQRAFLHLNVSETGSMDKTVMEALACGCPVLTSNPAFFRILASFPEFIISDDRPEAISDQVKHIYERRQNYDPLSLRGLVENGHDMNSYADRVLAVIRGCLRH